MAALYLTVPDRLKAFAEKRAAEMGYASPDEYVEALLAREEEKRETIAQLEAQVLEGLDSGPAIEVTDDYISQKLARLQKELKLRDSA